MPIHDWTRVEAGLFHAFHQTWTIELCAALNEGALPPAYFALPEQNILGPIPDVLALRLASLPDEGIESGGGITVDVAPPRVHRTLRAETNLDAAKANRVTVRHRRGDIVAVVEIVSPGNKSGRAVFKTFVDKSIEYLRQGVHLLVIDLLPPTKRDPRGVHPAIWSEFEDDDSFTLPVDKPLTLASYDAGPLMVAYIEPVAVGDLLPDIALFIQPETYIAAPLELSYQAAWKRFPDPMKKLLG